QPEIAHRGVLGQALLRNVETLREELLDGGFDAHGFHRVPGCPRRLAGAATGSKDALAVRLARPMLLGFASVVNHDDRHLWKCRPRTPTNYIESRARVCKLRRWRAIRRRRSAARSCASARSRRRPTCPATTPPHTPARRTNRCARARRRLPRRATTRICTAVRTTERRTHQPAPRCAPRAEYPLPSIRADIRRRPSARGDAARSTRRAG